MTKRLQALVIRTSSWPVFRWAYAVLYAVGLLWLVARLRRVPEILSLELRPPRRGHCFGSSDLDLRALTVPLGAREFFALADRLADVLLPGGTWLRIFDVYAFPEPEYALQAMIVAQSTVRERRWIQLLGRRPPEPETVENADAFLGRATYDYASMCQELFEGPLDLHHVRLLYSRIFRIDGELRRRSPDAADAQAALARDVLAAAHGPAVRGRVRATSFEALARAHALALSHTTALARAVLATPAAAATGGAAIRAVPPGLPAETLAAAAEACREPLADLAASVDGAIRGAIIGGVPGSRYELRIYLLVRDDLDPEAHVAFCRAVRALFVAANPRVPYRYFRMRYPVILTAPLWRAAGRWYHALRSVEEHWLLTRHGVVVWGEDWRADLAEPTRDAVVRSAAIAVADLRNRIWGALHHRRPAQLMDLVAGRVPALWLVLARSLIATSPAEAVDACVAHGFPHADTLVELHRGVDGRGYRELPLVDDPFWQPALAALSTWLDDLTTRAITALRE